MCLANVTAISERAELDDHPKFLTLILYTQKPRPPIRLKVILRKTRSCRPFINDISFSSVCRWITSAVWAVVGRAVRCWPTRTSWASSQRSTSWPPERDSSTAGWATPGSCSSPRCAAEVRLLWVHLWHLLAGVWIRGVDGSLEPIPAEDLDHQPITELTKKHKHSCWDLHRQTLELAVNLTRVVLGFELSTFLLWGSRHNI